MAPRSPLINVMAKAADKAGRALIRDFGEVEQLQVSRKGPADFVTVADRKAEQTIRAELARARPGYAFLMEEGGATAGTEAGRRWIVDPLDGTTNFLHGVPHWSISIALEEDGEIVSGIVFNPAQDEFYWAEKGAGAFLNDRRLRVSGRRQMGEALLATGIPHLARGNLPAYQAELAALAPQSAGIRRFGSAALDLAYVASGRFDGFWESGLQPWDVAAGIILVREAGGFVTEFNGRTDPLRGGTILAANPHMHGVMGRALAGVRRPAAAAGG